jgi:hypothetical protein
MEPVGMHLFGDLQTLINKNGAVQYDFILRNALALSRKICCSATTIAASAACQLKATTVKKNPIPQYRVESNPCGSEEEG